MRFRDGLYAGVGLELTGTTFSLTGQALALHLVPVTADQVIYATGSGTFSATALTPAARTFLAAIDAPHQRAVIGADLASNILYTPDIAGGQGTDVDDKLNQYRTLLDGIPACLHAAVGAGTNTADLTAYVQRVLDAGGIIDGGGHTYLISAPLCLKVAGTRLRNATFLARSGFGADTMMTKLSAENLALIDITLDGAWLAGTWLRGMRNEVELHGLRLTRVRVRNVSFTGIDLHDNSGTWMSSDIVFEDVVVENVGWGGISAKGLKDFRWSNIKLAQTGFSSLVLGRCYDWTINGVYINREADPERVYNGAGYTAIRGFFVQLFPTVDRYAFTNFVFDTSISDGDGFGLANDGTEYGKGVISNGVIRGANGAGLDVPGNCTISNLLIDSPTNGPGILVENGGQRVEQGVVVNKGGPVRNVQVSNVVIRNVGVAGKPFSGIFINSPFEDPANICTNISFSDVVVVDERTPKITDHAIAINTGNTHFPDSSVSFQNIDGREVSGETIFVYGNGQPRTFTYRDIRYSTDYATVVGATPYVSGHKIIRTSNATPTTMIGLLGGFENQEIWILAGDDNTTIQPDANQVLGQGQNRFLGNQDQPLKLQNSDLVVLRKAPGLAWLIQHIDIK